MNHQSISPYKESAEAAIKQFSTYVYRACAVRGAIGLCFLLLATTSVVCLACGLDFAVALFAAGSIVLGFLYYLIGLLLQENTLRKALFVKQHIDSLKPLTEGFDHSFFSHLANSTPGLVQPHTPWPLLNNIIWYATWKPFHVLGEVLLLAAIDQVIAQIRSAPRDPAYHASLANGYVRLANHYLEPMRSRPHLPWPGLHITKATANTLKEKARASSANAVEELSILVSFAPEQLWVHDQLAISYRELDMPEQEMREYETIIALCPEDPQALVRLGVLYFRQGKIARGLEIYERLQPIQPQLAEELISQYGAYAPFLTQMP